MTTIDIFRWLLGERCPLNCGALMFGWKSHDCPKLVGKTVAQQIRIAADLAQSVIADLPADRNVHGALEAITSLRDKFPDECRCDEVNCDSCAARIVQMANALRSEHP